MAPIPLDPPAESSRLLLYLLELLALPFFFLLRLGPSVLFGDELCNDAAEEIINLDWRIYVGSGVMRAAERRESLGVVILQNDGIVWLRRLLAKMKAGEVCGEF